MSEIAMPPQPDDIPDPGVPASVPQGVEINLANPGDAFSVLASEALRDFQEKLLAHPPLSEEARIVAQSPQGFSVMLITRKAEPGPLIDAIGKMQAWLLASGYKPAELPF